VIVALLFANPLTSIPGTLGPPKIPVDHEGVRGFASKSVALQGAERHERKDIRLIFAYLMV
jgi:hypothetical protein